jgi:hypothetical protein
VKQVGERFVPSMRVNMVFRGDRFLRGGDQTSFVNQDYAAVRLTTRTGNIYTMPVLPGNAYAGCGEVMRLVAACPRPPTSGVFAAEHFEETA